jgi:hypothetical protein
MLSPHEFWQRAPREIRPDLAIFRVVGRSLSPPNASKFTNVYSRLWAFKSVYWRLFAPGGGGLTMTAAVRKGK